MKQIKWRIERASNGFILYIISVDYNEKEHASRMLFLNSDSVIAYLQQAIKGEHDTY